MNGPVTSRGISTMVGTIPWLTATIACNSPIRDDGPGEHFSNVASPSHARPGKTMPKSACSFASLRLVMFAVIAMSAAARAQPAAVESTTNDKTKIGHSHFGLAFDEGPRQKPWKMDGIGHAHMQITSSSPEVQEWFDQGVTLLHDFWYYEAERAFRWCVKLDPDCAMAYWGLARSTQGKRADDFLDEAIKRKSKVTERERMYIEAEESMRDTDAGPAKDTSMNAWRELQDGFIEKMEEIILKYPDDIEAKAQLALASMGSGSRLGQEMIVREILAAQPDHPGAHHYRIHNCDDIGRADQALESCLRFGRIAPNSGHACHMPGHIYSQLGMFHEAAIWMDTAARVERQYMQDRLAFPQDTWNYPHDVHYLGYLLEQLGMAEAAIANAQNLLDIPVDPKNDDDRSQAGGIRERGQLGMIRALVKFERWDEIRRDGAIPWADSPADKMRKAYCMALCEIAASDVFAAKKQLSTLRGLEAEASKDGRLKEEWAIEWREVSALIQLKEDKTIEGLQLLMDAAEREAVLRKSYDDPPDFPRVGYNVLGEAYLDLQSPRLAIDAFRKTLEMVPNDGIALSGLTRAYAATGDSVKASDAYARLLHVWSNADKDLRWMSLAEAAGVKPMLAADQPPLREERDFGAYAKEAHGPERWQAFTAPPLDARDSSGARVTLDQFAGHNVLLVFYLGEECPHCMEQLQAIQKRSGDFDGADIQILAMSSAAPEKNAASDALKQLKFTMLSDDADHANARRFHAFDDFEDLELHATILIDKQGRVRWARFGGDPYTNFDLLLDMARKYNEAATAEAGSPPSAPSN